MYEKWTKGISTFVKDILIIYVYSQIYIVYHKEFPIMHIRFTLIILVEHYGQYANSKTSKYIIHS